MENLRQSGNEYDRFESALRKVLAVPKEQVKKATKSKRKKPKKKS